MKKKLILFDIDGTLIKKSSAGVTASLMKKHFGIDLSKSNISIDGKTYRRIFIEQLRENGVKNPEAHDRFDISMRDISPIAEFLEKGYNLRRWIM